MYVTLSGFFFRICEFGLFLWGFHSLMQFSAADAIDLGSAFRAGAINDSAAALVEISSGILNLTLCLTLYTISFHFILQNVVSELRSLLILPLVRILQNHFQNIVFRFAILFTIISAENNLIDNYEHSRKICKFLNNIKAFFQIIHIPCIKRF